MLNNISLKLLKARDKPKISRNVLEIMNICNIWSEKHVSDILSESIERVNPVSETGDY